MNCTFSHFFLVVVRKKRVDDRPTHSAFVSKKFPAKKKGKSKVVKRQTAKQASKTKASAQRSKAAKVAKAKVTATVVLHTRGAKINVIKLAINIGIEEILSAIIDKIPI